jgi:vacuolar-type H+-ATPase subunit F/Vma7
MSLFVVGDAPLVEAFELIGAPGLTPAPGQDLPALLTDLARGGRAQLLLVQAALAATLSEEQIDRLGRKFGCLVLAIPGVGEGPAPDAGEFLRGVRSAVGAVR